MRENWLLAVCMAASVSAHLAIGRFLGDSAAPTLPPNSPGRTSVHVQLVAGGQALVPLPRLDSPDTTIAQRALPATETGIDHARRPTERRDGLEPFAALVREHVIQANDPPQLVSDSDRAGLPRLHSATGADAVTLVSIELTGIETAPAYRTRVVPRYPPELQLAGIQGDVWLLVTVAHDGRVLDARLHHTSGQDAFDQSAVEAVRRWTFMPARRGGIPLAKQALVPIEFRLDAR